MPEPKSFATGMSKGLDLAIPLVIQKNRLDMAQEQFDQTMTMKKLELSDKAEQAEDKIYADFLSTTIGGALERGDVATANSAMEQFKSKFGYGFNVPEELPGETPDDLMELFTQGMQKGTPNEEVFNRMLRLKQASKSTSDKVPPDVLQARIIVSKFAQKIDPMTAMMLSMQPELLSDPTLKAKLDQTVSLEMKPVYDKSIKILEKYFKIEDNISNNDPLGIR